MNQQLYRIVFNKARGCLMAVAETATAHGKTGERRSARSSQRDTGIGHAGALVAAGLHSMQPLALALASAMFLVSITPDVRAQIVADPGAPSSQRPTVLTTGSGNNIPLVNIQTPSAAGVSRNTYSQFDVTSSGAVLNNSRTNVETQLGGWVQGNPWLATGGARVILNEVNSSNPSQLRGAIEVAGQRAEVIVANPAGIQVDGASFINTSRATVTTGTPILNGGSLDGYRVERGTVNVSGAGLDARSTDSTAILARAIEVNAGIWANQLTVTTGANQIAADTGAATAVSGTGTTPAFALDVAAIGGMYAGKITLVGTEAGLGVRNAGTIQAGAGDLVLNANGWLSNSGSMTASQKLDIQTQGALINSGTLYSSGASGQTTVASMGSAGNISNTGLIGALGDTSLSSSGTVTSASGSVLAAGLATDSTVGNSGNLTITANASASLNGQSIAGTHVRVTGADVGITGGQLRGQNLSLVASSGDVNATGATLVATQTLTASTPQTLRTDGAAVSAPQLALYAHDLSNLGGQLIQTGSTDLNLNVAGNLNNSRGTIAANSYNLVLAANALSNTDGQIEHAGTGALDITATIVEGQRGQTRSNGTLNLTADTVSHDNATASARQISITASNLDNQYGSIQQTGAGQTTLSIGQHLDNTGGTVASNGAVVLNTAVLNNVQGRITSGQSAGITAANAFNNTDGVVAASQNLALTGGNVDNTRGTLQATSGNVALGIAELTNNAGNVFAGNQLAIQANDIRNTGTFYATGNQTVAASGTVSNSGTIAALGDTTLTARSLSSTSNSLLAAGLRSDGTVASTGSLAVTTAQGIAAHGQNIAAGSTMLVGSALDLSDSQTSATNLVLNATAGNLDASHATLVATQTLVASVSQSLNTDNASVSASHIQLAARDVSNVAGVIVQTGTADFHLDLPGSLNNSGGVLQTAGLAHIHAQGLNNTSGNISASGLDITTTGVLDNSGKGLLAATQDLNIHSAGLTNAGSLQAGRNLSATSNANLANSGTIYAGGNSDLSAAGLLGNSGLVAALGNTGITAGSLVGTSTSVLAAGLQANGTLGSAGDVDIATTDTLVAHGQNIAAGSTTLAGTRVDVSGSQTSATHVALLARTGDINARQATLVASHTLTADSNQTLTTDGAVLSANQVGLTAHDLSNVGGRILQTGGTAFHLNLPGTLINSHGTIASAGATTLVANSLDNQSGIVQTANGADLGLTFTTALNNTDGVIQGAGETTMVAGGLENVRGSITTAGRLSSNLAGAVNNTRGFIASNGALTLQAASVDNQAGTIASVQNDLTLTSQGALNNALGHLQATGNIRLNSALFTNTSGAVAGNSTQIQTHGQGLLNQSGHILATGNASSGGGSLAIDSGALNNDAGLLQAGNGLTINTSGQTLTNTHSGSSGGIFAQGNANLTTGDLVNTSGFLAAVGSLGIQAARVANDNGGTLASGNTLAIHGNALDNSAGGHLQAVGDLSVDVAAGAINNSAGWIHANGSTLLRAASIDNSNTRSTSKGIEGGNVTLQADDINNQDGSIQANNALRITGSGQLNNRSGLVSSARSLSLQDAQANSNTNSPAKTLALTNTGGTFSAGQSVLIDSASLSFDGSVTSQGSLSAKLLGDYTHTGAAQWQADGGLSLAFTGNFTSTSALQVLGDLRIDAANISNTTPAQIAGNNVTLVAGNTVVNQGSVVGMDSLTLQAGAAIRNTGPGALLGAAGSNGTLALLAPVIENRDDTTATDSTPQTLIYGVGNVTLAGGVDSSGNVTRAQTILNQSAQIESGVDMLLAANQITNTRRELTVGNTFAAYGPTTSGQAVWTEANPDVPGGRYIEPPHGGLYNSDYLYNTYTQDTQRNSVTSISPEARILTGGDLSFNTSLLQNYWSKVAATGDISLGGATVDQDSWRGATPLLERTISSGTYEYRTYRGWLWNNAWGPQTQDTVLGGFDSSITARGTLSGNGATLNNGASAASAASVSTGVVGALGSIGTTPTGVSAIVAKPSVGGQTANQATLALTLDQASTSGSSAPGRTSSPQSNPSLVATGQVGGNLTVNTLTAPSVLAKIVLPSGTGGLFHVSPDPASRYLVETNPAFTNQKTWLSSDWYLGQLGLDPATTQKRLGDGFYEQRLVREQVLALTGRTQLNGYASDQAQYQALLAAGAATAQAFNIRPGITLSDAQIASLTTDVVMLEERTVQGQRVLVPVVYLAHVKEGDLLPSGALIAAGNVELYDSQGLVNRGTIRADNQLVLDGVSLDSRGGNLQSGGLTQITTRGNVDLTNAQLKAGSLNLNAGGSLLLVSTATTTGYQIGGPANSASTGTASHTLLDRIASIDVQGDAVIRTGGDFTQNGARLAVGGNLAALVGGNWNLDTVQTGDSKQVTRVGRVSGRASSTETYNTASSVSVGGSTLAQVGGNLTAVAAKMDLAGGGTLAVQGNIELSAPVDRLQVDSAASSKGRGRSHSDTLHLDTQTLQGTQITANNSLSIASGGNIGLQASSIQLTQGNLALQAAGDIRMGTQNQHSELATTHVGGHNTGLSNKRTAEAHSRTSDTAMGSSLGASTVTAVAGHDLTVHGSNVVSDTGTTLVAGNNLAITAATNTASQSDFKEEKKSGLMGSGGIGITVGKKQLSTDGQDRSSTASGSTVAALSGGVTLVAGNQYRQTGSQVLTTGADGNTAAANIAIQAKGVAITEARESSSSSMTTKQRSSGITLAVSSGLTTAIQSGVQMANAISKTSDKRMLTLAAATTALTAYDTYNTLQAGQGQTINGKDNQIATGTGDDGKATTRDSTATDKVGGVSVSLSYGKSSSTSTTTHQSDSAAGSTVRAAGRVSMVATGGGIDSNLLVQGSTISAGTTTSLQADNQISLLAARNTSSEHTTSQGKGSSIGVGFSVGSTSTGFNVTASASKSKSQGEGEDLAYTSTQVGGGHAVHILSGGDTSLQGAVVKAPTVTAEVGGKLDIQSLQDQSSYHSTSSSAGGSISIPVGQGSFSASITTAKTQANGNYQSVAQQSGIQAGDGGFQVNVQGGTTLTGATLSSSQAAMDAGQNSLTTATLVTQDLKNVAEASASSSGFSIGTDMLGQGTYGLAKGVIGNVLNNGSASSASSGTSYSAISSGTVTITNEGSQQALTEKTAAATVASLNRDTVNAQNAAQKQDAQALLETAQAAQAIKQAAFKEVTIHSDAAYTALFKNKTNFYKVTCSGSTEDCMNDPSKVTMQTVSQDEAKKNGSILAVNGILNEAERAGQLAYQNAPLDENKQKPDSIVLMHIAPASTGLGEIMVAGYEKLLAPTLGYSNADTTYADTLQGRGDKTTLSLGHSRGTIVQTNALNIAADNGYTNDKLLVLGVGGAVKEQTYVDAATRVTQTLGSATFTYLANDPVSVIAAGNQGDAWAAFKEFAKVWATSNSAHSCYGTGATGCATIANPVAGGPVPTHQQSQNIVTYRGGAPVTPQESK